MSYPTQKGTANRLEKESRRAGRDQENERIEEMRQYWEAAKRAMRSGTLSIYHQGHGAENWTLAAAGPTIESMGQFCVGVLVGFYNRAHRLISVSIQDAYRHEALRQVWMLDQLTPPSHKPKMPERALREAAARPSIGKWELALDEWLRAYAANLSTNLRLEALHEGSITDAADEINAAKIDGFDPGYKFSSVITDQILLAQREARNDVAENNDDLVAEEIFQTLEDTAVCPDCDSQDGKNLDDIEMLPHVYGFNCRCFARIVPKDFAELLRNGTEDEKQAALDMDARGLVPDAMAIKDPDSGILPSEQNLKAHIVVTFGKWMGEQGLTISGRAGSERVK